MRNLFLIFCFFLTMHSSNSLSANQETRISIKFSGSAYNSIANEYMERPTFATLNTTKKGKTWLDIKTEKYGRDEYGNEYINNSFTREHCDQYIALIDKYLEWESIATKDGDMFEKKIGKAKNVSLGLTFGFYSANSKSHFLIIGYSLDHGQYFSRDSAIALKELLTRYSEGALNPVDTSAKYQ